MTQLEAAANAPTEDAGADQRQLVQLIVAAVLMGATGVILVGTGVWALTFNGLMSRELRRALNGHTLTSVGVLLLVVGLVLLACVVGVLIGPKVNRWVGLVARLAGIVVAAVAAFSGIWLVRYYPGWAITYTALGALVVFTLTSYERELRASWPWASLRARVAKVLALNTQGVNVPRGVAVAGLLLLTLVVTSAVNQQRYFLSVAFGLLFVALSDPGGEYLPRLSRTAMVGVIGALLTALGYGIGADAWGWVVLAIFAVTALTGLVINVDVHALVAGILLNVWFLITLSTAAGLPAGANTHPWNQALAWLIGAAMAIALISALWLMRGESRRRSPLPEIPDDVPPVKLGRPIVLFILIRAIAVSGAAAIAFGLHITDADWMPLATLVAMKPTLQQSTLRGVQRLVGTALGAAIAAVFLVTVTSTRALEEIIVALMGVGVSIYSVNYAFYTAAVAGAVLIALDLPHPTNLDAEGRRIFYTFVGIAIAIVVMFLASLLQQRKATTAAPQQSRTSIGKDPREPSPKTSSATAAE
jgi:Fusaric acid resistance protein-like